MQPLVRHQRCLGQHLRTGGRELKPRRHHFEPGGLDMTSLLPSKMCGIYHDVSIAFASIYRKVSWALKEFPVTGLKLRGLWVSQGDHHRCSVILMCVTCLGKLACCCHAASAAGAAVLDGTLGRAAFNFWQAEGQEGSLCSLQLGASSQDTLRDNILTHAAALSCAGRVRCGLKKSWTSFVEMLKSRPCVTAR